MTFNAMDSPRIDPAGPDLSLLPAVVLEKIVSHLDINDMLNFAATCRSFHEAVFASDTGSQLFVLCTNEVHRVRVKSLTSKRSLIEIDPLLSFWSWTTEECKALKGVCKSIAKLSTRVSLTVDDKVKEVGAESVIASWLKSMDTPGISSLILRPCNMAKATFPDSFCDFMTKLSQLIALNAGCLRELHFVTWPLEAACRKAGIPMIHEILEDLPQLKNGLKAFTYLWQGNDLRSWQPANMSLPADVSPRLFF